MKKNFYQVWRDAKCGPISIKEMSISHLINTFHFLKRKGIEDREYYIKACNQDLFHPDVYEFSLDQFVGKIYPEYIEIRKEIANRLRLMKEGSIERKYWYWRFSNDVNKQQFNY